MACASITSSPTPKPGQTHRSSDNFATSICGGHISWSCPDGITFDVMVDMKLSPDYIVHRDVTNGAVTSNPILESAFLYIANPRNAPSDFLVAVSPA